MIALMVPTPAPLPEWLEPPAPSEPPSIVPALDPPPAHLSRTPKQAQAVTQLRHAHFANLLETALVQLTEGIALPVILRDDPRGITPGRFLQWVFHDADRKRRYYDALELGAEIVYSEVLSIADATDAPMEDVQRSKLRIDTRKWWASVANRNRFGDIKKLDVTTQTITEDHLRTLSIDDLKRMVVSGEYRVEQATEDDMEPVGDH